MEEPEDSYLRKYKSKKRDQERFYVTDILFENSIYGQLFKKDRNPFLSVRFRTLRLDYLEDFDGI